MADLLPIQDPIYEFGSLQVAGQKGFADLRPLFPRCQYVGCDMRQGPGVDVLLNLHKIDLPNESAGTVLCLDTLEHVEYPRRAIDELHRILKPNGIIVISSVMDFPIHDYPFDYWRFTPEAFKSLLRPFSQSLCTYAGDAGFPHTVVGIGFKNPIDELDTVIASVDAWRIAQGPSALRSVVKPLVPPILLRAWDAGWRRWTRYTS